jgi:N-glycosylase/DNA lyase
MANKGALYMKNLNYADYKVFEIEDGVVVEGIKDFNLVHIFECGQCFRWLKQSNGSYTGVVAGKNINMSYSYNKLTIKNTNKEDFEKIWYEYLDLGTDYSNIKYTLSKLDEHLAKAVEFGNGIRILRQDLWETLISFIISANNGIPRIMKTIEILSREYGNKLQDDVYSFPDINRFYELSVEALGVCKGGFRCKYIYNTARVLKEGIVDISALKSMETNDAKMQLKKLPGVGPKVADCVLLFSGTKFDVFPTDVWVKRVMEELYFGREASFVEINAFADKHFGELKGYAQQYLFYYARENKIGK